MGWSAPHLGFSSWYTQAHGAEVYRPGSPPTASNRTMFVLVLSELDLPSIKCRSEWKEAGPLIPPTALRRSKQSVPPNSAGCEPLTYQLALKHTLTSPASTPMQWCQPATLELQCLALMWQRTSEETWTETPAAGPRQTPSAHECRQRTRVPHPCAEEVGWEDFPRRPFIFGSNIPSGPKPLYSMTTVSVWSIFPRVPNQPSVC